MRIFRLFVIAIPCVLSAQSVSLTKKSETFERAQVTAWVGSDRLAVARWDGTLSIFRQPKQGEFGPVLTQVVMVPALKPVEAVIPVSGDLFATSNGDNALALWKAKDGTFSLAGSFSYDAGLGAAESGTVMSDKQGRVVVSGHTDGSIVIWRVDRDRLHFVRKVSLRSSDPIPSPYKLWNVRAIVPWGIGKVVTGSEDGDIVLYDVVNDKTLARMRYNVKAQRGINSLSVMDDYLLLANCSVGSNDKNLWLYKITNSRFAPLDAINLVKNTSLPQVFDFSTQFTRFGGSVYFLASTEEGLVWLGKVSNDKLEPLNNLKLVDTGARHWPPRPTQGLSRQSPMTLIC
jgi:WD40 repeat protein